MAKLAPLIPVYAETETAAGGRFLILECGHWQYPTGQGLVKRRRCRDCLIREQLERRVAPAGEADASR